MARLLSILMLTIPTLSWASQDPTAPLDWITIEQSQPVKRHEPQPLPKLQSIICVDSQNCKAVLNDQVVMVGERVSGYNINKIESERVVISSGNKRWNLELFSMDIKQ